MKIAKISRAAGVLAAAGMFAGVSVSGFAAETDPWQVYEEALTKQNELDGMDMSMSTAVSMMIGDQINDITLDMDCQMNGLQSGDLAMAATMNYTMGGEQLSDTMNVLNNARMYYTGGYLYMDMFDADVMGEDAVDYGKIKYPADIDSVMAQFGGSTDIMELNKEAISDLTLEEDGDTKILRYALNADNTNSIIESVMGQLGNVSGSMSNADLYADLYQITECTGTMTINSDGYIESQSMDLAMNLSVGDGDLDTVYFSVNMDADILNPGQEVTVELPDDLDSYSDYEALLESLQEEYSTDSGESMTESVTETAEAGTEGAM